MLHRTIFGHVIQLGDNDLANMALCIQALLSLVTF